MKQLLFTTCVLASCFCFGQQTKKVTIQNEIPEYTEVFYVLLDSPDVKHGAYTRTFKSRHSIREKGQYSHGDKSGVWTFEGSNGDIEQEIDFSSKKVISAKPFKNMVRSSIIMGDSLIENISENLPLFLGGQSRLSQIFVKYMRYPATARRYGVDGIVYVSATVTKDGKLIDERVEKGIGSGLDEESLRIIQMLPDEWLPVGWGDEPRDCRVVLQVKYKLN